MHNIMLDLETLGTTADAVIMSIGAVKFDLDTGLIGDDAFYASVCVDSNQQYKRRIDSDTLIWWFQQTTDAQAVMFEPKIALPQALEELTAWCLDNSEAEQLTVWSNGADFDIPMLAHAFSTLRMELPWCHWNTRCYRTYKNLPGAKSVPPPERQGVKHNALADALYQAKHLQAIHKALFQNQGVTV